MFNVFFALNNINKKNKKRIFLFGPQSYVKKSRKTKQLLGFKKSRIKSANTRNPGLL